MTDSDDTRRMRHMVEAAEKALRFVEGKTRSDLNEDEILCLALLRLLEIIGEAGVRVSQAAHDRHAEIPWPKIIGMRNRLVHGYDEIDLEVLWQTLGQDLKPLINSLKEILFAAD